MHGVQDHLPPASVMAILRDQPALAAVALPEGCRGSRGAAGVTHPPKPTDIPKVEDLVTLPRGYVEFLEDKLKEYQAAPAAAQPPAPRAAAAAARDQEMADVSDPAPVLAAGQGGVDARAAEPPSLAHAASR